MQNIELCNFIEINNTVFAVFNDNGFTNKF